MFSLEVELGTDSQETTNSYFAYVEERLNQEAKRRAWIKDASESSGIVVEYVTADLSTMEECENAIAA